MDDFDLLLLMENLNDNVQKEFEPWTFEDLADCDMLEDIHINVAQLETRLHRCGLECLKTT